jgi:hypothetical protein
MSIRSLLVAVPFALGIACSHSSKSHASSSGAGSSAAQASAPYGEVVTTAGNASEKEGLGTSAEGSAGSSSASGSQESQSGTGSGSSMDEHKGEMGSGGSSESMGTDKSAQGGSAAMGAGETVAGKLTKVSKSEVQITPKGGSPMTLKIGDQTVVTMNGKSAKPSQLKKGQSVHASYTEEGGAEIATKIDVSSGKHHKGSSHPTGTGSSEGSDMGGSSGSGGGSSQ